MIIEESTTPIVDKHKVAASEHDQTPPLDEATMPATQQQENEVVDPQGSEIEMPDEPDEPFWRRPTGRGPVGKEWDTRTGTWVPLGKAVCCLGPQTLDDRIELGLSLHSRVCASRSDRLVASGSRRASCQTKGAPRCVWPSLNPAEAVERLLLLLRGPSSRRSRPRSQRSPWYVHG